MPGTDPSADTELPAEIVAARRRFGRWAWVHKWASLVCTAFLLMLCITGLPLIFHHEIDHLLHADVEAANVPPGTPRANLDRIIADGLAKNPGQIPHFLIFDREEPNEIMLSVGASLDADPRTNRIARLDIHTGAYLGAPDVTGRFTYIMLKLHTDMFAGMPGKLFLGFMSLLFCIAIVSGIVVYAPAMRKLPFGAYRRQRPRVVRWLDIHNLVGIALVAWMLVVGLTGVVNTLDDFVIKAWQSGQLADMTAKYRDSALPTKLKPVDEIVRTAEQLEPAMTPAFVAWPGTLFSSKSHYAVFMRGSTPLTARLLKPALIDAETGELTDSREMPWYVSALFLSQPLHFGDYGGMPLKIIWAILDVMTIAVLVTGLYLWLRRRRANVGVLTPALSPKQLAATR